MKNSFLLVFTIFLANLVLGQNRTVIVTGNARVNTIVQGDQIIKKTYVIKPNTYQSNDLDQIQIAKKNTEVVQKAQNFFKADSTKPQFKILVMPLFQICERQECSPDFGSIIYSKLLNIAATEDLNFGVYYLKNYKLPATFNSDSAFQLKKLTGANLIVYGIYDYLCLTDTTLISLNWISDSVQDFTKHYPFPGQPQIQTEIDPAKTTLFDFMTGKAEGSVYALVYYISGVHSYSGKVPYANQRLDMDKSIDLLTKGLAHCNSARDSMLCLSARAHVYYANNGNVKGIQDFSYVINKNPDQLGYRIERGRLAFSNQLYDLAIEDYQRLKEFHDSIIQIGHANYYGEAAFYIVNSYLAMDSLEKAVAFWRNVETNPFEEPYLHSGSEIVYACLAHYCFLKGQLDSAIHYMDELISRKRLRTYNPEGGNLDDEYYIKSYLETANQQYENALADLNRVKKTGLFELLYQFPSDKMYRKSVLFNSKGLIDSALYYANQSLSYVDTLNHFQKTILKRQRQIMLYLLYEKNHNLDSAIFYLNKLSEYNIGTKEKYAITSRIAMNYAKKGKYALAAQLFDSVSLFNHSMESDLNASILRFRLKKITTKALKNKLNTIRDSLIAIHQLDTIKQINFATILKIISGRYARKHLALLPSENDDLSLRLYYEKSGHKENEMNEYYAYEMVFNDSIIILTDVNPYPWWRSWHYFNIQQIFQLK